MIIRSNNWNERRNGENALLLNKGSGVKER